MAGSVWALAPSEMVEHMQANLELEAKDWLFLMHETLAQNDFTRLVITLWEIWRDRRKAIHEKIFQSPLSTLSFINSFLDDLESLKQPAIAQARN